MVPICFVRLVYYFVLCMGVMLCSAYRVEGVDYVGVSMLFRDKSVHMEKATFFQVTTIFINININ